MEYLIISQFAERAGVTPQAIYKRIKGDLAPYVKEENGIKLISEEALEFFKATQQAKQAGREQELIERNQELESLVAALTQDKLDLLQKIAETNTKLLEIIEKQSQQQENFQILLAQNNRIYSSLTQLPTTSESPLNESNTVELNSKKTSLFARIFKRP